MFKQFHISPAFHIRIVFLFQIHFNLQLHHIQMRKHYRIISYAGGFCALLFHIYTYTRFGIISHIVLSCIHV